MVKNPHTARALVSAVMEAARWIEASAENKRETAQILSRRAWLNCKEQYLTGRMLGEYDNGLGQRWQDAHPIRFFNEGAVSYPYLRRHVVLNPVPSLGLAQRRAGLCGHRTAH